MAPVFLRKICMMRKLKLQVQMTIDGFICGPNGEMDFIEMNWDAALGQYVTELTNPVETIVLGRKLAEGFIPYWASVANDAANPEAEAGKKFTDTQKIVFSNTLNEMEGKNTTIAKRPLAEEINALKNQEGGDIIAYGGATFVSNLIREGLIDDFHLFINPTAIGSGRQIFDKIEGKRNLRLVKSSGFDCGIVVMHYEKKQN
jgi:dihydrofolate reductase